MVLLAGKTSWAEGWRATGSVLPAAPHSRPGLKTSYGSDSRRKRLETGEEDASLGSQEGLCTKSWHLWHPPPHPFTHADRGTRLGAPPQSIALTPQMRRSWRGRETLQGIAKAGRELHSFPPTHTENLEPGRARRPVSPFHPLQSSPNCTTLDRQQQKISSPFFARKTSGSLYQSPFLLSRGESL